MYTDLRLFEYAKVRNEVIWFAQDHRLYMRTGRQQLNTLRDEGLFRFSQKCVRVVYLKSRMLYKSIPPSF
jgi:hypothetical protein